MASTDLITVETFWSIEKAHLARGYLEREGIACHLENLATAGNLWIWNAATGGVKLRTFPEDAERATVLLHGVEHHDAFALDDSDAAFPAVEFETGDDGANIGQIADEDVEDDDANSYHSILEPLRKYKGAALILAMITGIPG